MKRSLPFLLLLLSGCSLAPDLKDVLGKLPDSFKEAPPPAVTPQTAAMPKPEGQWKVSEPADTKDKGEWWKIFSDPQLDALETQAAEGNLTVRAMAARVNQARALSKVRRADLFPSLDAGAGASRSHGSANAQPFPGFEPVTQTVYSVKGTVSYEANLFGDKSDNWLASLFDFEASEADYRSAMLGMQADVAQQYYLLRALDEERRALRENFDLMVKSEELTRKRLKVGYSSELDNARAIAQMADARAQYAAIERVRANAEHALAVLLGKAPAEFTFPDSPIAGEPPSIPAGLPSALLERRPDIAAAQRRMAAANKRIGVARAAMFPKLALTATGGFESTDLSDLFKWSSNTWAWGPLYGSMLAVPIFQAGAGFANVDRAKGAYEESALLYKQQVLVAFREVEDSLSGIRLLGEQLQSQEQAANAARRAANLSNKRYQEGDLSHFEVVDAERGQLGAERALAQVKGQRYAATIDLIRALGGAW